MTRIPTTSEREAEARIEALLAQRTNYERKRPDRPRFSLEPTRRLLDSLGCLKPCPTVVQIGGSKGKGTTAAYLEAMLSRVGRRVGVYSSPHLVSLTERIRIDGAPIPVQVLEGLVEEVARVAAPEVSFFELMTAVAGLAFQRAGLDIGIFEVGLGGRLDSTTAVEADLSILTRVELEHTEVLGPTVHRIAQEKAHVFRRGAFGLTAARGPARVLVASHARRVGCTLQVRGLEFDASGIPSSRLRLRSGTRRHDLRVPGAPPHESEAIALAFAATERLAPGEFDDPVLDRPGGSGRCELRSLDGDPLILDVAHTGDSARALADFCRSSLGGRAATLLYASATGKRWQAVLSPLLDLVDEVLVTELPGTASEDPVTIRDWLGERDVGAGAVPDLAEALAQLRARSRPRIVTGSFVLVGEALRAFA
ncbi:MAG: hypothetical protein AAF196_17495 [Planctomycetota bacterium]